MARGPATDPSSAFMENVRQIAEAVWEIPQHGAMRVPARIYATRELMDQIRQDNALEQCANVAQMPGILRYSLAMPDIHWGYGFPIGGVAAFHMESGVISPGGVGYDINCGVRLMRSDVEAASVDKRTIRELVNALYHLVPTGTGHGGVSVEAKVFREE